MKKIFYIMGKSSSGKDTIKNLVVNQMMESGEWEKYKFANSVMYTTRPMREGEVNGETYHFVDKEFLDREEEKNAIVEQRVYHTKEGDWYYFTHENCFDLENHNYIYLNTLEAFEKFKQKYGEENVVPIYIWIDDVIRIERALAREKTQPVPKIGEMCRRFLADEEDFRPIKIANIKDLIGVRNDVLEISVNEVHKEIIKRV